MFAPRSALHQLIVFSLVAVVATAEESLPLAEGGTTPLLHVNADGITVTVAPELGGKVISLIGPDGVDRLSRSGKPYHRRTMAMTYGDSEFDGLDEVIPSLATVPGSDQLPAIPDHGDAWRLPWHVTDGPGLTLTVDGQVLPYRLTRSITIAGRTVTFAYRLENRGDHELPWTYCFHPLFTISGGLDLELPEQQSVQIAVSGENFLGANGSSHSWRSLLDGPLAGHAAVPDRGRFWKALIIAPPELSARLRWHDGTVVTMSWSGDSLHHAGIWSTEGAILNGLQHLAVEPCTALEDRLDTAITAGSAAKLLPGASTTWTIRLTWEPKP